MSCHRSSFFTPLALLIGLFFDVIVIETHCLTFSMAKPLKMSKTEWSFIANSTFGVRDAINTLRVRHAVVSCRQLVAYTVPQWTSLLLSIGISRRRNWYNWLQNFSSYVLRNWKSSASMPRPTFWTCTCWSVLPTVHFSTTWRDIPIWLEDGKSSFVANYLNQGKQLTLMIVYCSLHWELNAGAWQSDLQT